MFVFITGDFKLVRSSFIDAASRLPPPFNLPRCHSAGGNDHAVANAVAAGVAAAAAAATAAAFASLLLILVESRPTDDETFLSFSGAPLKRFLIFFFSSSSSPPTTSRRHLLASKQKRASPHLRVVESAGPHITK